ncbi:MAG TPA: VOC family protein [Candidatus Enterococcus stercoripullorum]|nr:VOC family protein [Candidatus Enterococcus stercoripullorum]
MKQKEKVVLHLWFDTQAMEAAQFYTSIFQHSKVIQSVKISDTPSGEMELVSFSLERSVLKRFRPDHLYQSMTVCVWLFFVNHKKNVMDMSISLQVRFVQLII